MRFLRIIPLLLFLVQGTVFSQETAVDKLQNLEESSPDSIAEESTELVDFYLADTVSIAEFDTTYFMSGDPESNLLRAAEFGQIEVVKMLVNRGVYVDATSSDGVTPIMYASQNGDIEILEFLILHEANVNSSPMNGVTALLGAVRTEQYETVRILLESGAEVNAKDEFDLTSLMHAAAYNYPDIVELLIDSGANLEAKDWYGSRPLMMAAFYNCLEAADVLLDKGADPDGKDNFGFTPLMIAAQHGDYDMAWLLLDKGADPSLQNEGGLHAMALAVMKGDEDIIELLAESGADINQDINLSTNSLSLAEESKNERIKTFLVSNGARPNRKPEISEIRGGLGLNFNGDDFMVSFDAGVSESKYNMYLTTGIIFRPAAVRVLRPENDTMFFQLWEKRYIWPITIGKDFTFHKDGTSSFSFRIHLTGAYTWGKYRGSSLKPDPSYLIVPGAGLSWKEKYFGISFDYQYVPVKVHDISSHRFTLSINGFYDFRTRMRYTRKDISWF